MSIVFASLVPHPPFLIPSIGKENLERLKTTVQSFKRLEEDLYSSKAETIIIISPHGSMQKDSFSMNLNPEFEGSFEAFGDLATKINFFGDISLAHRIKEHLETKAPLQLISEKKLDYGSGVPLSMLTKHLPNIKIIPLYYSGLDLNAHFEFGKLLKRELMVSEKRIAIIASGDLSHKLTKDAPAGYSSKAKSFDKKIIEALIKQKTKDILDTKEKLIAEVSECGLKSMVILLGVLDGVKYKTDILSYEAPFGVGYLTANFKL